MRRFAAVVLIVSLIGFAAGCGSSGSTAGSGSSQTQQVHFAKTKFLLHAGLAFGAFHRYIYKPFKSGAYRSAGHFRKALILAKGALAALFIYHEAKLAAKDAQADPLLRKLVAPLTALSDKAKALGSGLRGNQADTQVAAANSDVSSISAQSANAGKPIQDVTPPANLQPVQ